MRLACLPRIVNSLKMGLPTEYPMMVPILHLRSGFTSLFALHSRNIELVSKICKSTSTLPNTTRTDSYLLTRESTNRDFLF